MNRKWIALLLLALVVWAQVDDQSAAWLPAQSSTIPVDDDEYLVSVRSDLGTRSPTRDESPLLNLKLANTARPGSSMAGVSLPEPARLGPVGPDPLYALMSMQC